MKKYYRVIKENFLWEVGAVIAQNSCGDTGEGYSPVDEVFRNEHLPSEYISNPIIENTPEYFERVYPVNLLSKTVYKAKQEAKEMLQKEYKGK